MSVEPTDRNLEDGPAKANGHMHTNIIHATNNSPKTAAPAFGAIMNEVMSECISPLKDPLWFKGANAFATRKTVLASFLDLTVLVSNAGQLKTLMRVSTAYPFYNTLMGLLITCIIIEISVGVMLFALGRFNINRDEQRHQADVLQNITTGVIIVLFILNVMITAFGIEELWYVVPNSAYPTGYAPASAAPMITKWTLQEVNRTNA